MFSNGSMFNVLDTYKTLDTFDVFVFLPTPFSHSKESAFIVGTEDCLFAIYRDESLFFTMSQADFIHFQGISGKIKICPSKNVVSRNLMSSCLSSLFCWDFSSASKLCLYNKPLNGELVTQLSGNEFILHRHTIVR